MAREIIAAGLENREFIERATVDFDAYKAKVESYTLEYAERETGVPAEAIRELAHAFATAPRAMICWTLGITEHHNAVDNVLALISLVLLTGHVGRYGSGVNPLRGQNNVQGGGDMGALPDRLPGFQHVENDALRAKFDAEWGVAVPPKRGWHLSGMFDAMERGELTAVYCIGENPVQSEADQKRAIHLLEGLDFLVVQDLFLTKTAELADVVLPAERMPLRSALTVSVLPVIRHRPRFFIRHRDLAHLAVEGAVRESSSVLPSNFALSVDGIAPIGPDISPFVSLPPSEYVQACLRRPCVRRPFRRQSRPLATWPPLGFIAGGGVRLVAVSTFRSVAVCFTVSV
jgi:hypothetical protein